MVEVKSRDELRSLQGERGTVVVFVANGCPTARAYEDRLNALAESVKARGINLVAINSNNASLSPPDTQAEMEKRARDRGFRFPYLKDPDGALARSFGAVCTPHAFLLGRSGSVVYEGRIDDSRLGDRITSRDLENAIGDLLAGRGVRVARTEPFGCSIVW
jgi:thiol-disulfide isomerase/thioredoxin